MDTAWIIFLLIINVIDLVICLALSFKLLRNLTGDNNENIYLSCFANRRRIGSITNGRCNGSEEAVRHNCIECPYLRDELKRKDENK